jgi:hypothetical protein
VRRIQALALLTALSCSWPEPPACVRWGKRHVEAFDETEPRVFMCAVYKCGATTTHHEAHEEPVCLESK